MSTRNPNAADLAVIIEKIEAAAQKANDAPNPLSELLSRYAKNLHDAIMTENGAGFSANYQAEHTAEGFSVSISIRQSYEDYED